MFEKIINFNNEIDDNLDINFLYSRLDKMP